MTDTPYVEIPCVPLPGGSDGDLDWPALHALREAKLARLQFRRSPVPGRAHGEAMSFITPEVKTEFDIPDAPPVSDHDYGGGFSDMLRANAGLLFLDIGAGLRGSVSGNMVNTEIYASASTDIVCIGEDLPFESGQFDYVFCAAVLEHTRRPWEVAREICRVLKPGGILRIDWPLLAGVHGYPHHYFNATPQGVISLFEAECYIGPSTIEANNHPIQALWWILSSYLHGLEGAARERFASLTIGQILSRPPAAQMHEPYCANLSEATQRVIPAGSTLVAMKKHATDPAPNGR